MRQKIIFTVILSAMIFIAQAQDLRFLLVKAPDVATYVEHGIADLGVVGSDVLYEHPGNYLEMLSAFYPLAADMTSHKSTFK